MSCPVCHESRYWSPNTGCLICNSGGTVADKAERERERERFVEALRKIAAMDYTRAATNGMGFDAVNTAREAIGLPKIR